MIVPAVYIIIPVYNEAVMLREVLVSLHQSGYVQIIVVDDGSTEDVFYGISDLPVYFLRHRINLGQGAALQTGFEFAKRFDPQLVITFDADGQHDINDLPALMHPLLNGEADIALGSRFLKKGSSITPFRRKWVLKFARLINYLFTGLLLSDAHNGLRALNRKALKIILIKENRMAHATELLLQIRKKQLKYKEVAVNIRYTSYSRKKGQSALESIKILFDLVLHKLFK